VPKEGNQGVELAHGLAPNLPSSGAGNHVPCPKVGDTWEYTQLGVHT
jgi:hypothetical protein